MAGWSELGSDIRAWIERVYHMRCECFADVLDGSQRALVGLVAPS